MNIFVLDLDPKLAAESQCNKHVPKMIVESVQLLCTAHPASIAPYKHTHVNHPCAKWVRQSLANYNWLVLHSFALCDEYTKRFGKIHATEQHVIWCSKNMPNLPNKVLTPFARAIKEPFKTESNKMDIVQAYRHYYSNDKRSFAQWEPRTSTPAWWKETFQLNNLK